MGITLPENLDMWEIAIDMTYWKYGGLLIGLFNFHANSLERLIQLIFTKTLKRLGWIIGRLLKARRWARLICLE
jgi:hypothetical protein